MWSSLTAGGDALALAVSVAASLTWISSSRCAGDGVDEAALFDVSKPGFFGPPSLRLPRDEWPSNPRIRCRVELCRVDLSFSCSTLGSGGNGVVDVHVPLWLLLSSLPEMSGSAVEKSRLVGSKCPRSPGPVGTSGVSSTDSFWSDCFEVLFESRGCLFLKNGTDGMSVIAVHDEGGKGRRGPAVANKQRSAGSKGSDGPRALTNVYKEKGTTSWQSRGE